MPRRRKAAVELTPERKKELRKARSRERRKARKADDVLSSPTRTDHDDAQFWAATRDKMAAGKILNDHRERPYIMSIPKRGPTPSSGYYPCSMYGAEGRWYFCFLFRQHRDAFFKKMRKLGARKEITG